MSKSLIRFKIEGNWSTNIGIYIEAKKRLRRILVSSFHVLAWRFGKQQFYVAVRQSVRCRYVPEHLSAAPVIPSADCCWPSHRCQSVNLLPCSWIHKVSYPWRPHEGYGVDDLVRSHYLTVNVCSCIQPLHWTLLWLVPRQCSRSVQHGQS